MSDKSLLERLGVTPVENESDEPIAACKAFGWLPGIRDRAVMLQLRRKNGNIRAIPYGWIEQLEFDPSEGITLHTGGRKVRIRGRHLNTEMRPSIRLFDGITRQRVSWIQEASGPDVMTAEKDATVVEAIEW